MSPSPAGEAAGPCSGFQGRRGTRSRVRTGWVLGRRVRWPWVPHSGSLGVRGQEEEEAEAEWGRAAGLSRQGRGRGSEALEVPLPQRSAVPSTELTPFK